MNRKIVWILCAVLSISVVANVLLSKANIGYFDKTYGEMAEQHLLNSKFRDLLEQGDIEAAKSLINQEIEAKGALLAVCLIENCSSAAKKVMQGYE